MARNLIAKIGNDLRSSLEAALDDSIPRQVRSVSLVVRSNRGETFTHSFADLRQAIDFMQNYDEEQDMDTWGAPSLLV